MARSAKHIQDLAKQIEDLPSDDRMRLLRRVLTPQMDLSLLAEDLRRKTRRHDPRAITRDVNRAVREIRRAAVARRSG